MSGQNLTAESNTPRVNLREVETAALQQELRARERCANCGTQNAKGWKTAGKDRVLCDECAPAHAVEVP